LDHHQSSLALIGRIDPPTPVPTHVVEQIDTFREAVRVCWRRRRVHYMTRHQLAAEAGLYVKHVSDYLAEDDKPGRRSLPGEKIASFEAVCGNSVVTQWLARRSSLTVLEQMQADNRRSA
jgi:hypothetical protein